MDMHGDPFAVVPAASLIGFNGVHRVTTNGQIEVITLFFAQPQVIYAEGGALLFCPAAHLQWKKRVNWLRACTANWSVWRRWALTSRNQKGTRTFQTTGYRWPSKPPNIGLPMTFLVSGHIELTLAVSGPTPTPRPGHKDLIWIAARLRRVPKPGPFFR